MWILILTMVGYSMQSGHAVTAVPGFTTEQACLAAANKWLEVTRSTEQGLIKPRAVCAKA